MTDNNGLGGILGSLATNTNAGWRSFIDGYFTRYNRMPKRTLSVSTLLYCRDFAAKLIGEQRIDEYKKFIAYCCDRFGVNVSEALEYIQGKPVWMKHLTSTENLESGDPGEAIKNAFDLLVVSPLKGVAATIGSGISGVLVNFLKKLAPVLIILGCGWFIIHNRHKLISKK